MKNLNKNVEKRPLVVLLLDTKVLPSQCTHKGGGYIERLNQSCKLDVCQSRNIAVEIYTVCYTDFEKALLLSVFLKKVKS